MTKAPIFDFQAQRDSILQEVIDRSFYFHNDENKIDYVLNNMAYNELTRLEGKKNSKQVQIWQDLYRSISKSTRKEKERRLHEKVTFYVEDIVGRFNPAVYQFATSMVPSILSFIWDPHFKVSSEKFKENLYIDGQIETIRNLSSKGTLILVPTHSSNLDSVAVGYALYQAGLPPFTYGAGKNLFTNPILSFFMHNLGAYRVDRRLRFDLYKNVLKIYSQVLIEHGFHSLFFPGGTRGRSGQVEHKLKLGLLGTGMDAYIQNMIKKKEKPGIFIVPATLNYHLVLEAETLIGDYLKAEGKSRYIIEDDESSKITKVFQFYRKMMELDTSMHIRFCEPMDIFGNRVDENGVSYDNCGRVIDTRDYITNHQNEVIEDPKRDAEYTREAGQKIAESYMKNNVILSTHLVSYVFFRYLEFVKKEHNLFKLIRIGFSEAKIQRNQLIAIIDRFRAFLREQEQQGILRLGHSLIEKSSAQILSEAVRHLQMLHSKPVVHLYEDKLHVNDMKLLFYYHNRLKGYNFERRFEMEIVKPLLAQEE